MVRKIKDAKDLSTNELIYFKGHAQATYMSDGRTVEEAIKAFGGSSSGNADPSVMYFDVYSLDNVEWVDDYGNIEASGTISQEDYDVYCNALEKNKFGVILDNMYLNSTAIDKSSSYASIVYSVFYDEAYAMLKYVNVCLVSDLNVSVTTGIIGGNSNGSGSGTLTSVKVNGISKSPSSGVVDLGYINKQLSTSTSSSMTLSPNVYYRNTSTSLSSLTITLGSVSNSNIINEYFVEFTTRSAGTTVSFPSTIKWANGETPTFEAGCTYQVSIVNNLGVVTKFK